MREDLGERGDLVAQEGEFLATIARDHVHGLDATRRKAALHRPGDLHRGERANRLLAGKGAVHDRVEAMRAAGQSALTAVRRALGEKGLTAFRRGALDGRLPVASPTGSRRGLAPLDWTI